MKSSEKTCTILGFKQKGLSFHSELFGGPGVLYYNCGSCYWCWCFLAPWLLWMHVQSCVAVLVVRVLMWFLYACFSCHLIERLSENVGLICTFILPTCKKYFYAACFDACGILILVIFLHVVCIQEHSCLSQGCCINRSCKIWRYQK